MGMSMHIVGIKEPDTRFKRMKAIWDNCVAVGVDIPKEVEDFFEGEIPDDSGVVVDLDDAAEWQDNHRQGFEIRVGDIPEDVTIIRFYNSY